jgi:hypothetical protein
MLEAAVETEEQQTPSTRLRMVAEMREAAARNRLVHLLLRVWAAEMAGGSAKEGHLEPFFFQPPPRHSRRVADHLRRPDLSP